MPRMGMNRKQEKSKDFKGSMKRLLGNLKPWRIMLLIALSLAMISAILALISPNKLSDLTDIITEGLTPNLNEEMVSKIMADTGIIPEDKLAFSQILQDSTCHTERSAPPAHSIDQGDPLAAFSGSEWHEGTGYAHPPTPLLRRGHASKFLAQFVKSF